MLKVNRALVEHPEILGGGIVREALEEAGAYFAADYSRTRQQQFKFKTEIYRDRTVLAALGRLFANKCAFCESAVDGAAASQIMHHFRPKQEAIDADGSVSRPHYWWLAYEWENLYLSCQRCATAAGAQFPVAGKRADPHRIGAGLQSEESLLVDPCSDDPDQHLEFLDDGTVVALSERGKTTIEVYSLNRTPLTEARRQAIEVAREGRWTPLLRAAHRPYAEAVRQAHSRAEGDGESTGDRRTLQRLAGWFRRKFVHTSRRAPLQPVIVERLELQDFRGVEELKLHFATPDDEVPWTVLLGENGHSKTSVLQALALVLMGEPSRKRSAGDHNDLIRDGAETALITVWVRGEMEPRTLRIDRNGGFKAGDTARSTALAAYGAARIPSTRRRLHLFKRRQRRLLPRAANLFDAATPLVDAKLWLIGLDQEQFDFAARALRRLLLQSEDTVIERDNESVFLVTASGREEMGRLSDGYRSVIALGADLMSFFLAQYGSMDAARGIVLIDEISAHLHPAWQMHVVESFRSAFPELQFVVTTHDPLCLRGLADKNEVAVLRRTNKHRVYVLPDEEVPQLAGLRVDELLTSEVFGLSSSIDPELEQEFNRYYDLLASHDRNAAAYTALATLKEKLDSQLQLGSTRRERLVLEAADEYLAEEGDVSVAELREQLLGETRRRLRAIWAGEEH